MKSVCFVCQRKKCREGFALLLMLLLVIVLGAAIWLGPRLILSTDSDPNLPWNEEFRLLKDDEEPRQSPSSQQASIEKAIQYKATAKEGDSSRGEIEMFVGSSGRIKGNWSDDFRPDSHLEHVLLSGGFSGNIDPSKIYRDEQGEDLSKLYFIANGAFVILETNEQTNKNRRILGEIYVTGWLDPEYMAVGKITVTSDKKNFKVYTWQGKGDEISSFFGF